MDLKKVIEDVLKKLSDDKSLVEKFQKNPVETIEKVVGIDLPDEQINQIVTAVKAKFDVDKAANLLSGFFKK